MRARALTIPAIPALLLAAALAVPAMAQDAASEPQRTITVQGEGTVTAKPDTANVTAGVVSEAKTAREALTANNDKMANVVAGLKDAGIAEDDIRTSGFAVNPVYSRQPRQPDGTQKDPEITGYRATNTVSVTVRDLSTVGRTLDEVVTLGANNVNGISFYIDKPEGLMDEARTGAVEDALRRASVLAKAAKLNLGRIMTINEGGSYRPQPMMARMEAMDSGGASVPVAPGTQEISANVTIVIELE